MVDSHGNSISALIILLCLSLKYDIVMFVHSMLYVRAQRRILFCIHKPFATI